jgi:hypothetical protein
VKRFQRFLQMNDSHQTPPDPQPWVRDDSDDDAEEARGGEMSLMQPADPVARTVPAAHQHQPQTRWSKRTAVPILLTWGALMIGAGTARWMVDEDSVLADLPKTMAIAMLVLGAAVLALAAVNMRAIRRETGGR